MLYNVVRWDTDINEGRGRNAHNNSLYTITELFYRDFEMTGAKLKQKQKRNFKAERHQCVENETLITRHGERSMTLITTRPPDLAFFFVAFQLSNVLFFYWWAYPRIAWVNSYSQSSK